MRSTPGRPYPLIIPLSTGLGKHSFAKIAFSHKVLTTFPQNVVFSLVARGKSPYRRTSFWGSRGNPKLTKKRHEKNVLKKMSLKRPLGCHGEPRGAPGSQNDAKMDAKRLPKDVQKRRFFRIGRKMEKCKENILFTTLQPHRPHQKITILGHFAGPKMTSKPRGDRMGPKCRQRAPQKPPERVQSSKLIPTGRISPWGRAP